MTKIIKRAVRVLRQLFSNGKKQTLKKTINRTNKNKLHRGGAVYSFDLNDKIGGMPSNVSLNGTIDGDCPSGNTSDIGFSNYGAQKGGNRNMSKKNKKSMKTRKSMKSHKSKSRKSIKRRS